jgi:CxxC-x17-CxxC domain-containing protein
MRDNRSNHHHSGGDHNQNREMHKATCSGCNQECEVPFKPTEGRDVFCKECFQKNRKPQRFNDRR